MKKINSTLRGYSNLKGANKLDLQFFADKGGETSGEGEKKDKGGESNDNSDKTYTQEELDKLLQTEGDRRVTSAREKFEKEYKEKLEKQKKEVERLSQLSADEKEKELIKQKEEELAEKEQAIQLRELQLDTINILSEEKLPVGFAEFLIKDNAETTQENIKKFKKEWQEALAQAVDEKIKGNSPRNQQSGLGSSGVEDFMTMANEASIRK